MGFFSFWRRWFPPKPPVIVVAPPGARVSPPPASPPSAPTVTTQAISSITTTTATGNGTVTSDGGAAITQRGVCWNTSLNPTTSDSTATSAGTTGAYTASITGLSANTGYHVRAYAINSVGTSYGADTTFTSSSTLYPNQPVGTTVIAETDDTQLPVSGTNFTNSHVLAGNATLVQGTDWSLATIATDGLPACPTGQTKAIKLKLPTGLAPGNSPSAGFYLWDNVTAVGANGGPAANEYSTMYVSLWVNLWGDGSGNFEVPAAGLWKLMYFGCTWNNLPASGPQSGFGQLEYMMLGVTKTAHTGKPDTYTQFGPAIYTQNFTNQDQVQNMNTGTRLNVKSWHQLELVMTVGTDQHADGGCDIYIDGTQVAHYTNTQILDSTQTLAQGQPGNAGYDCFAWTPVWGGGGGANKSRDDFVYYGHAYMSGVKLRDRT